METRRLEYFTALAEGGNFSRAAERLGISQPALSQQIQRLEEEVGAYLFDRTARPVVLTEVGERLLARSADVLEHIRAIERLSTAASRGRPDVCGSVSSRSRCTAASRSRSGSSGAGTRTCRSSSSASTPPR